MRIYVASTPYHLLVAAALQISTHDMPAVLMYDDEYGFVKHVGSLGSAFPGASVRILPSYERSSRLGRVIGSRRSANAILRTIRAAEGPVKLFVCCPTRSDLLRTAHRLRGKVPTVFVEDGLDAYLPHSSNVRYERVNLVHHLGTRLVNGFPSPDVFDNTTVLDFQEFHVLLPELFRGTIDRNRIKPIAAQHFREGVSRLQCLTDPHVPDGVTPTNAWFPSHSKYLGGGRNLLRMIAEWSQGTMGASTSAVCVVKLHPRETSSELREGIGDLPLIEYPSWIPAELLLHRMDERCHIRMGLSTFVLSSKILKPSRQMEVDVSVEDEYFDVLRSWDDSIGCMSR